MSLGPFGELAVSDLLALYSMTTLRGYGFIFSTVTAASITNLGNNIPTLFNPLGSGVVTIVDKVTLQAAAIGTPVISGLQYGWAANMGANIGTAAPIPTATFVAGVSTLLNSNRVPKTLFAPAAITFTAAPALFGPVGVNLGATATQTPWQGYDDLAGRVALLPGSVFQLGASTATSTTFNVAFWVREVPLPNFLQ
jgi:hypothetical protein